jgi:hypothetical protein
MDGHGDDGLGGSGVEVRGDSETRSDKSDGVDWIPLCATLQTDRLIVRRSVAARESRGANPDRQHSRLSRHPSQGPWQTRLFPRSFHIPPPWHCASLRASLGVFPIKLPTFSAVLLPRPQLLPRRPSIPSPLRTMATTSLPCTVSGGRTVVAFTLPGTCTLQVRPPADECLHRLTLLRRSREEGASKRRLLFASAGIDYRCTSARRSRCSPAVPGRRRRGRGPYEGRGARVSSGL